MAHSPALRPDTSETSLTPSSGPETLAEKAPDLGEVKAALDTQGVESSELALDLILHDIAERARQATGASGAAIALERDGSMVCRAAAGATAPDLGVSINTESGLTGSCIREERAQWCPDTDADDRVDAEACRQLQVRSIVVVPLFARERVVGVFEIFSGEPRAFGEHELRVLQELATWVTETIKSGSAKGVPRTEPAEESLEHQGVSAVRTDSALLPVRPNIEGSAKASDDSGTKALRLVVLGLAVLLCVLLGFRWGWQKARLAKEANQTALPSATVDSSGQPEQILDLNLPAKPSPAGKRLQQNATSNSGQGDKRNDSTKKTADERGGNKENAADHEVLTSDVTGPRGSKAPDASVTEGKPSSSTAMGAVVPLPSAEILAKSTAASALVPISAAAPARPANLATPVSQGVTPGRLLRRINPNYPSMAIQQRISGAVVLQARIGKDGHVHDVKVVSGHPFLASAATDAVRQWQYEPYKLNGQPVDLQTQITVNFNLP